MSSITIMVKELVNQPVTEDTESLFSERTKTLIRRIAEKCQKTNSPVDEYIWKLRADDLLFYLVRECSGCKPEVYIEMLARILVPMINDKLAWEEESEKLIACHEAKNMAVAESIPVSQPEPAGVLTGKKFFCGLRAD